MRARKSPRSAAASTFPGYTNIVEIATGSFASVYRAVELGTGRAVALKVLRVADTSPHVVEAFKKELGALALLSNHPNVTTLYRTFFTPEGRPVLVLELCRESLAQRIRQSGPMPPPEVIEVGVKVAGALATAHRSGLLHRDMKPQNILVSQFGEPVLADFGVVALQASAQSTEGVFGFTTLHAPPEALEGQPLSPAADIYGLASSMYQMLLGRGPFAAYEGEAPASVILRILRDPAPRAPITAVPVALADLLQAALAKDPEQRPRTAEAFAESLRDIQADEGWPKTPYVVWGIGHGGVVTADQASLAAKREAPASPAKPAAPASPQPFAWLTASPPASKGEHPEARVPMPLSGGREQPEAPSTTAPSGPRAQVGSGPAPPPAPVLSPLPGRLSPPAPSPARDGPRREPGPPPVAASAAPQPPPPGTRAVVMPPATTRSVIVPSGPVEPLPGAHHPQLSPPEPIALKPPTPLGTPRQLAARTPGYPGEPLRAEPMAPFLDAPGASYPRAPGGPTRRARAPLGKRTAVVASFVGATTALAVGIAVAFLTHAL
jgi:serine/threonine protein kinase